jgi:hypothetical protein
MNIILLFLFHLASCLRAEVADATETADLDPSNSYSSADDNGTYGYYPTWSYVTEPDITSPKTNWLKWDAECDDGRLYFISPKGWGLGNPGPISYGPNTSTMTSVARPIISRFSGIKVATI